MDEEIDTYYYDKSLDLFIFGDNNEDAPLKGNDFCESLPDQFSEEKYSNYIKEAVDELSLPETLIKEIINENYVFSSGIYRRKRLKLVSIYKIILEKYYPNGLWIYGDSEIEDFRRHIKEDFGEIKLGSNHALISGIIRVSVLSGRGVYKPRKEQYISEELRSKIEKFIDGNPRDVIIFNNLYAEFENELNSEGVDNRYYLQGVIKEIFGDKYFYRKDILSKTAEMGNASRELINYVHESRTPVTMKEILSAFPGVTQIMVSTAMQDPSIIKFFWSYMYVGNLILYENDKKYFKEKLDIILSDGVPHHDSELFEIMNLERHDILSRLGILYPYNLYSVIEYLFSDYYNFYRPYIAKRNIEINHPLESINDFVANTEVFDLSELLDVAKQLHYQIPNLLDLFNGYNESHLFISHYSMGSINYAGVNSDTCKYLEDMFKQNSVVETTPIAALGTIGKYPHINIQWNEWVIYSIINKWGVEYDVGVVGNSFHNYIPIISLKGTLNKNAIDPDYIGSFKEISDLDNIDDLLIDIIEESDLDDF